MQEQEPNLVQIFLSNCCRSSDIDFNDPKLEELYNMSPQALLDSGRGGLLPNMISYFNKLWVHSDLQVALDKKEDFKRRVAAALAKSVATKDGVPFFHFGLDANGILMFQPETLAPVSFNTGNSIIVRLIPKLNSPAQKYNADCGMEDYI